VSTPQLGCFREIVRGVHVEEEEVRIRESPHLVQREDTDPDSVVEANRPEVTGSQAGGNGFSAGWTVGGAQGLDTPPPIALREHGVTPFQSVGQRADQRLGYERHVPGDAHHGCGGFQHGSIDATECSEAGTDIDNSPEIGPPGAGVRCVSYKKGWNAKSSGEGTRQAVEDPFATNQLQPLGLTTEPRCSSTRQDGPTNKYPLTHSLPYPLYPPTCLPAYPLTRLPAFSTASPFSVPGRHRSRRSC
jgi:hypothetical protein